LPLEVFTQRNYVADFIRFRVPFGELGVTYALHIQLVGNPVVNVLVLIIEPLLLTLCGWDERKSVKVGVFKGDASHWAQISDGSWCLPPATLSVRKLEWLPFRVVSKYPQCIIWFCYKARVWHTDGWTELWQLIPRLSDVCACLSKLRIIHSW